MFWRKRSAEDFAEEIKAHLELEADDLKQEGLSEDEARWKARRAFGNVSVAQERFTSKTDGCGGINYGATFALVCVPCARVRGLR